MSESSLNKYFISTIALISIFLMLASVAIAGSGRIAKHYGKLTNLIVEVQGSGTVWIGCTVHKYGEKDLKPQKMSAPGVVKFDFSEWYADPSTIMDGVKYTVAVWQDKISKRECYKKYGDGSEKCRWAEKNGYQMEGRLDSQTGNFKPSN